MSLSWHPKDDASQSDFTRPIPITIVTGFLGAGKTTVILNLTGQLPIDYKVGIIKNELGDVEVDSALLRQSGIPRDSNGNGEKKTDEEDDDDKPRGAAITGIKELANGCVCCNLVGQMADALEELRTLKSPDRIIIETSGSALPATLVLEINRLLSIAPTGRFVLDGVISVVDTENWAGYTDTSTTAKLQSKYTDLIVLNKWEQAGERKVDDCLDHIYGLDANTPITRSDQGYVSKDLILGLDSRLSKQEQFVITPSADESHERTHKRNHQREIQHSDEVDIVSVTICASGPEKAEEGDGLDLIALHGFLTEAPRQEIYRIKALVRTRYRPTQTDNRTEPEEPIDYDLSSVEEGELQTYALNWAFERWKYTLVSDNRDRTMASEEEAQLSEPLLRMTVVTAPGDGRRWKNLLQERDYLAVSDVSDGWEIKVTGMMY